MTQQAVTDAFVRYCAQLLFDRLDRRAHRLTRGKAYREYAGEPTDRATEVKVVEQVFAAMAFQLHQYLVLRAPLAQGAGQRGQQQVVDLRAVGGRGLLQ
ncbi:hypothetical protein D3C80_1210500 [compost metagenome]